jgi:hypothetical protein
MNRYAWRFPLTVLAWSAFLLAGAGLDASGLAANANHLAQDAREADARFQQSNAFPQVQGDWQEAMRLVNQIRAIAAY